MASVLSTPAILTTSASNRTKKNKPTEKNDKKALWESFDKNEQMLEKPIECVFRS